MRLLYLWFNHLGTDLASKSQNPPPHALTEWVKNTQRLATLSPAAITRGLRHGQQLADAYALIPGLIVAPLDRKRLSEDLLKIGYFCQQFSPLVALDGEDSLVIDITGIPRLYGGEEQLMTQVIDALKNIGLNVRAAIADTKGAGWALTHYGSENTILSYGQGSYALNLFPIKALRLEEQIVESLNRLGIKTIYDLMQLDRKQLTRRYGREVVDRLGQTIGTHSEPLTPLPPESPLSAELKFPDPLSMLSDLILAAEKLITQLLLVLRNRDLGLTELTLCALKTDGQMQTLNCGFASPTRNTALILNLLEDKLETLHSDYGFESLTLHAKSVAVLKDEQSALLSKEELEITNTDLLTNLGNRLGFENLRYLTPQATHIPEEQIIMRPTLTKIETNLPSPLGPRPEMTLPRGEPIEIITNAPDGPPSIFRWRRQVRNVHSVTGPERISPPWWRMTHGWCGQRDYWCVQTEEGPRLWLYRNDEPRWFVAGEFG
ncbi:MAG: hypothetical protein ACPGRH_03865 [Alphaproteobacteria bacterium]